jgi:hypothetical protein
MTTGATGQLGLALPVQGELSGTWGDTVNNGITQYTNIAIAATLTLTNDGAVTLANTTGDASASNIVSSLTGAGTVTAQFAIVRVTGTLTTAKVVTAPSYSKTYTVVNAATGGIVTFKASGQPGVSIAVGESAFVYYNGTDYVKVSSTVATGVTSFTAGTTGLTPSTATTGAVTLAGTLAIANGGTGTTSTTFANLTTNVTGTLPIANGGTGTTSTTFANLTTNVTGTLPVANGGTNLTSFTANGVVYASSTSALATGTALTFSGIELLNSQNSNQGTYIVNRNTNTGTAATAYFNSDATAGFTAYTSFGSRSSGYTTSGMLEASSGGLFSVGLSNGLNLMTVDGYPVKFGTNNTERMRLDTAGYLSGVWADKVTALGNSGTATTITCTAGNVYTATLTGNCTFTLASPSTTTSNTATSFTLILTNDATAGRTVAWAGGTFKFPGGSVTRTTTANATDIWFFFSPNGGTTWYGSIPMANVS